MSWKDKNNSNKKDEDENLDNVKPFKEVDVRSKGYEYMKEDFHEKKKYKSKIYNHITKTFEEIEDDDDDYVPYKRNTNNYASSYYGRNSYGGYGYGDREYTYGSYWSSYSGATTVKLEEDKDLFIKESASYITPTTLDINRKTYNYNMQTEAIKLIKEFSRFFFYQNIEETDIIDEKYKDLSKLNPDELAMAEQKLKFYEEVKEKRVFGSSPLDKAITLFNSLNHHPNGKPDNKILELREDVNMRLKMDDDVVFDSIYNEIIDEILLKNNKVQLGDKSSLLNKLSLIKNFGSKFKIEKEIDEKPVAVSRIHGKKIIRNYSDLPSVELYQRLLPNYKHKLYTKSLIVNSPIEKTEHKQKIIMLVDYSGSMSDLRKQEWVTAILIDRVRMAMKEECEIFFSFFLTRMSEFHFFHIHNRETAIEFLTKKFSTRPTGGDTHVGYIIEEIHDEINYHKRLHNLKIDLSKENPEILIINDGQDTAKADKFKYKSNAINLFQNNEQVKKLCKDNNGVHVFIDMDSKMTITEN